MASKKLIEDTWNEAQKMRGKNPDVWRKDSFGNKIRHSSYGTVGEYGWEIDHKNPKSKGGSGQDENSGYC